MTQHQNTDTDSSENGFEERLLQSFLDNFDEITHTTAAEGPHRPGPPRRRMPLRLGWAVPAVAAAGVAALLVLDHTGGSPLTPLAPRHEAYVHPGKTHVGVVPVRAHERVLYRLAAESLSAPAVTGLYAILPEVDTETDEPGHQVRRTSVDNTLTGASITYQTSYENSPSAPAELNDGPEADQTAAYYDTLPTDPGALYTTLLAAAELTWEQSNRTAAAQLKQQGFTGTPPSAPTPTDSEFVYEYATNMLWSPVVGPTLRSALYKVLADCQNVTVDANATDMAGEPAIEISQSDSSFGYEATYEDPGTGRVLEQAYRSGNVTDYELYQPVTSSDTIPADPYGN